MRYKNQIQMVALKHNITLEEADSEIRAAIEAAGYDMEPAIFIALASVKEQIRKKQTLFSENQEIRQYRS